MPVEGDDEPAHDVVGHVLVDVVGQLHEPEAVTERAADPPRQVARVDGQAVTAHARPRREPHVAERLGGGGVDGLPHVDAEIGGEHGQLVDEGDVHVPEGVLQQLGELSLAGAGHRHRVLDDRVVEALDCRQRLLVHAGDDLGGVHERVLLVARVDPLGAVAEVEVVAGHEAGGVFQDRPEQLLGRAWVGGRLEDDGGAGAQEAPESGRRRLDVRQVRIALPQRGRHGHDGDVESCARLGFGRGLVASRLECRVQHFFGDVFDIGLAGRQALDAIFRHVVTDDAVPDVHRSHCQRQADVPLSHHNYLLLPRVHGRQWWHPGTPFSTQSAQIFFGTIRQKTRISPDSGRFWRIA